MTTWDLPTSVHIDGQRFEIENDCDYRMVLDCLDVYEDPNLDLITQHQTALVIFYKEPWKITNPEKAVEQMLRILNCETEDDETKHSSKSGEPPIRLMRWGHDFKYIAPAVSRVLGYDVRTPGKFTHFWTFMGAFMEVGECTWRTFINIRQKKMRGENLDDWEQKIYREHKDSIDLPQILTDEEQAWLDSDW